MTVEKLPLRKMPAAEAMQAAERLLDHRTGPPRLERVLVVDDTALLDKHGQVYQHLAMSPRVHDFLCVAVGPRPGGGMTLPLPRNGNLAGTQGTGVLWVADPDGIDCRVAVRAKANGRVGAKSSGLDLLLHLLSVDAVFDHVHQAFEEAVPGRIANPGLKLAGEEDEAAVFAAALAAAIQAISDGGTGADGPFPALLPAVAGGARLEGGGPLARYRDEVADYIEAASYEIGKKAGVVGRFRGGDGFQRDVIGARDALSYLRDLVAKLLQDATTTGDQPLTANQRKAVHDAGVRFPAVPQDPPGTQRAAAEQSAAYRAVADAIHGGDTLALVSRRVTKTSNELKRHGSAAYYPEVERRCPAELLARLSNPPQRPPRRTVEQVRQETGLDGAEAAAKALTDLVLMVANREWSPATASPVELSRVRIAVDGVRKELIEHAGVTGDASGRTRGSRLRRLSESLAPVLRDLVLDVVAAEVALPSASGRDAHETARKRTARRLEEWSAHVQAHGVSATPPFASESVHDVQHVVDQDMAEIREALSVPVEDEMWQLCEPRDLGALNMAHRPVAIRFASRLAKDALAGKVAADDVVWTSSGRFAGLLRLVPLRPDVVEQGASSGTEPS